MAIKPVLRFVGTGDPMKAPVSPRIRREASQKGVERSGVESASEFKQIVQRESKPSNTELGRKAVEVQRTDGLDLLA